MSTAKRQRVLAPQVLGDPICLLAFGLGLGLMPAAPGTFGTLLGIPLFLWLGDLSAIPYAFVVGFLFGIGVPLCAACEKRLGVEDHSGIVWDEIVGVLITLWGAEPTWQNLAFGFVLFRLFDVLKPWPIRLLDRSVHGGLGIMLDDVLAGAFGWGAMQVLRPWLA